MVKMKSAPKGKEWLYVGHYTDTQGRYILKIGTTNDLHRRATDHTRNYRKAKEYTMPAGNAFEYDWALPLSKYNTIRFEDKNRREWQNMEIGEFVQKDRFNCGKCKPEKVEITIRKTYTIQL